MRWLVSFLYSIFFHRREVKKLETNEEGEEDEIDRAVVGKADLIEQKRKEMIKNGYIKMLFKYLMEQPTHNDAYLFIRYSASIIEIDKQDFHILADEFIKVCSKKGIKTQQGSGYFGVETVSFVKYIQRCQTRSKKTTITTSAYR